MEHDQPDFQPGQLLKVESVEPPEHLTVSTSSGVRYRAQWLAQNENASMAAPLQPGDTFVIDEVWMPDHITVERCPGGVRDECHYDLLEFQRVHAT
jgi:hypothetical protein